MKESQYIEQYLDSGLTVSSFLNGVLKGKAKEYSGKYARALQTAIDRRVKAGEVQAGPSKGGKIAYYRRQP